MSVGKASIRRAAGAETKPVEAAPVVEVVEKKETVAPAKAPAKKPAAKKTTTKPAAKKPAVKKVAK